MRVVLIIITLGLAHVPAFAETCFETGERDTMLALDFEQFDRTQEQGWRLIADRECYAEAAALIADYREATENERANEVLRHHQVQMYAAVEDRVPAIVLLDEIIAEFKPGDSVTNLHYTQSTRAFLAKDLSSLKIARADLASVPQPDQFEAAVARFKAEYPDFPPPSWPPNLDVVDGFINCFDRPYSEAYDIDCRELSDDVSQTLDDNR